jgi:hypothetical protein
MGEHGKSISSGRIIQPDTDLIDLQILGQTKRVRLNDKLPMGPRRGRLLTLHGLVILPEN